MAKYYHNDEDKGIEIAFECANCGEAIVEGEDYYNILGTPYCEDCISDMLETAEIENPWEDADREKTYE